MGHSRERSVSHSDIAARLRNQKLGLHLWVCNTVIEVGAGLDILARGYHSYPALTSQRACGIRNQDYLSMFILGG